MMAHFEGANQIEMIFGSVIRLGNLGMLLGVMKLLEIFIC